ncbi:MAG: hypothetical protein ABIS86_22565 [Streptosporangiaceae bacterium]
MTGCPPRDTNALPYLASLALRQARATESEDHPIPRTPPLRRPASAEVLDQDLGEPTHAAVMEAPPRRVPAGVPHGDKQSRVVQHHPGD